MAQIDSGVLNSDTTYSTFCFSRESFHPKSAGTTGYADLISASWPTLGYS